MVSENLTYITQSSLYGNTGTITWFRNKKKEKEHLKAESDTVKNLNVNKRVKQVSILFCFMEIQWSVFATEAT